MPHSTTGGARTPQAETSQWSLISTEIELTQVWL
uniref:Uncharacterized protein n=1 Tax=Anguilla anguilla TaxID=7936 RepID=A0A0E9TE71_ANGAN